MYRDATEDQLNAITTVLEKTGLILTKINGRDTEYWATNTGNGNGNGTTPHKTKIGVMMP
jgi:hypothetical protein